MRIEKAAALVAPAVRPGDTAWADVGAGSGTFTRALVSLLPVGARVIAVERDPAAVAALGAIRRRGREGATIEAMQGDFTTAVELPPLDGVLFANSLHYIPYDDQARVLRLVAGHLRPHGRLVIVEYERRAANLWVPFPISFDRLRELGHSAGLSTFERLGSRASRYGGAIYAAAADICRGEG